MINDYLAQQIKENFHYQPTLEQVKVIKSLSDFLLDPSDRAVFVLIGYAGTGKTSLMAALVRTLDAMKMRSVLLAPTGRAAKVFSSYSGHKAYTIHRRIYRQKSVAQDSSFLLADNLSKDTLFIVDEASMISNAGSYDSPFGSGRLLDDLIRYVYSGERCRLMLLGDTAQLPPVGEECGPALSSTALEGYGLRVTEERLVHVVRQTETSGILWNATRLRQLIDRDECFSLPKFRLSGFSDVRVVPGDELIDQIEDCYSRDGLEETIVICRSNKRANIYNNGIRAQVLWREDELESGDMLMVARNNYHWLGDGHNSDFIANGEMAEVRRLHGERSFYGFRFIDATLSFPDHAGDDGAEVDATLLLDTLHSEASSLSAADSTRLYNNVLADYADVPLKADRMKKLKADPYYNALQVKYAYAVTCHKAQGGQWRNVFIDQGYMTDDRLTPDYFRWLYTALTRATGTVYLVNYPEYRTE